MSDPFEIPVGDEQECNDGSDAETLDAVRARLEQGGFAGLVYPGECGCTLDNLAPCGECRKEGKWLNGCEAGYKHMDPRPLFNGRWIITPQATAPTLADFDYAYACAD